MKKATVIILLLAMMLTVCGCAFGLPSRGSKGYVTYETNFMNAMIDEDGKAHFATFSDEGLTIKGENESGRMSYDRKKLAVLDQDGTLTVYTDVSDLSNKDVVANDAAGLRFVGDYGIFYEDGDKNLFMYSFVNGEKTALGNNSDIDAYYLNKYYNLLYAKDGGIYLLKNDTSEPEKIAKYDTDKSVDFLAISKDCNIIAWSIEDGQSCELFIYENGEAEKVGTMELSSRYGYVYGLINEVSNCTILYSYDSDVMYIKPLGKDVIKVKLGKEFSSGSYTKNCLFRWDPSDSFTGLYVLTDADTDKNLYYIDAEGDREKVLSGVKNYHIFDGCLYYTDSDSTLYYAKLNGAEIDEPVKLSNDVSAFSYAMNAPYIYYLKNYDRNEATLYMYKSGDESPVKVSSGVYASSASNTNLNNSMDGKTVYYFKDVELDVGDTYNDVGTLYAFTYGSDGGVKISGDVVVGSVTSGYYPSEIDPSSFVFKKYDSDTDDAILVNWMFYNGSESTAFAKDLIED